MERWTVEEKHETFSLANLPRWKPEVPMSNHVRREQSMSSVPEEIIPEITAAAERVKVARSGKRGRQRRGEYRPSPKSLG